MVKYIKKAVKGVAMVILYNGACAIAGCIVGVFALTFVAIGWYASYETDMPVGVYFMWCAGIGAIIGDLIALAHIDEWGE